MDKFKSFVLEKKWLFIILFAAFALSIFYSFYYQIKPRVDARAYDQIAQNIVAGNGFRDNSGGDIDLNSAINRAGPAYEYFLAGIYRIFGHSYPAVWIIQALLRALSALFLYLAALLIFDGSENKKKIALWAAAIFAFFPDLVEISAMLMTETLYLFMISLVLYVFFLYFVKLKGHIAFLLGIAAGLAVLTRPPVLLLLPIMLFYPVFKRKFLHAGLFLIALILVFLPWTVRNYKVYNEIMPFGAGGSMIFWIGNYHGSTGEQIPSAEQGAFYASHTVKESNDESISRFKSFVLNYPGEFAKLTLIRINKYFSVLRPMGFWFYNSGWKQILFVLSSAIYSLLLFVLSFGGILRSIKLKNMNVNYLLLFTLFTPLLIFITVVETRYRFQIYPFLTLFAAYYISLFEFDKRSWFKNLLVPSAVVLSNGIVDGLLNFNVFKDKIFSHFG